jgi:hypothetical protein
MMAYLESVRHHLQTLAICLILDQYRDHDSAKIHTTAHSLNIETAFVPKVDRGKYPHLDGRTFGALKAKGRAKWNREHADHRRRSFIPQVIDEISVSKIFRIVIASQKKTRAKTCRVPWQTMMICMSDRRGRRLTHQVNDYIDESRIFPIVFPSWIKIVQKPCYIPKKKPAILDSHHHSVVVKRIHGKRHA